MQLYPASLEQARLATERVPVSAWADKEVSTLRARGLSVSRDQLNWPIDYDKQVYNAWGTSTIQYNLQPMGMPDVVRPLYQAQQIYHLYRVTLAIPMSDGRYEKFVTYIGKR